MSSVDNDIAMLWFGFAFVNANLAQLKNRSGLAWFLISLPLGPFAPMILAFFKPRPSDVRSNGQL